MVSTDDCSIGEMLSVGWTSAVRDIASQAHLPIKTEWVIYSSSKNTTPLWARSLSVQMVRGSLKELQDRFGIAATPWTIIINAKGLVAKAWLGNTLPLVADLEAVCR